MDSTTRQLAEIVCAVDLARIPAAAVHEAKRRILDSVACAAGAYDEQLCADIRGLASRYSSTPSARVWFSGQQSSVEMAGFANGTMVRFLDMSDTVLAKAAGHPSDMIPALIALAEGKNASGERLLEGIIAAYELYVGLCEAIAFQKSAVDQSTAAALGAAGGASRILGLDQNRTGNAIALALGSSVNLYNVRTGALSDWKACSGPNAARQGVFAATVAAEGITGPTAIFDGKAGFAELVGPIIYDLDTAQRPRIAATHLKAYPVCYHGQSAVDAAMKLAGVADPENTQSVLIETYEVAWRGMANDPSRWAPENRETADHSLPYTVAVTLSSGRLKPNDYGPDRLADPSLRQLMQRIEVRASDECTAAYPGETRTRISLTMRDGRTASAETTLPKGHRGNPMSDDELIGKLDDLWPASLPPACKSVVADQVWRLETMPNIRALVDSLCGAAQ